MAEDLAWLISQPRGRIAWQSTRRALAEMVHIAWATGMLTDPQGRPLSQQRLAEEAFGAVGQAAPRHLTSLLARISRRQDGARSMVACYKRLAGQPRPISRFVKDNSLTNF